MTINSNSRPTEQPQSTESSPEIRYGKSWFQRIRSRLWGYDFFISYHWGSGGQYSANLAQRLIDAKYDVFIDQTEYAMGDDWKKVGREALANTQRLVLIATREAVTESKPVEREITLFTHRKRQIIPIVFDDSFDDLDWKKNKVLSRIGKSKIRISEKRDNLEHGPSDETVQQLVNTHGVMRVRTLRRLIILIVIFLITVAAIVAESQRQIAVGRYAQSEASAIWSNLVFEDGKISSEDANVLLRLAETEQNVRDAFLEQLLTSNVLSERFANMPREITRALVGLDTQYRQRIIKTYLGSSTKIDEKTIIPLAAGYLTIELEAIEGVNILIEAIKGTKDLRQINELARGLVPFVSNLTDTQAKPITDVLVEAIHETSGFYLESSNENDAGLFTAFIENLAGFADYLTDIQVKSFIESQVYNVLHFGNYSRGLGSSLATITGNLTGTQAKLAIEILVQAAHEAEFLHQLEVFMESLLVQVDNLSDTQAKSVTELLIQKILDNQNSVFLNISLKHLTVLADNLTDNQVKSITESLIQKILETGFSVYAEHYVAIADNLTETQAMSATSLLIEALLEAKSTKEIDGLSNVLTALPKKLTNAQTKSVIDGLVQAVLLVPNDSHKINALDYALTAFSKNLMDTQARSVIDGLAQAMLETDSFVQLDVFMKHLVPYAKIITDIQAKSVIDSLVRVTLSDYDYYQPNALGDSLTTITTSLTDIQAKSVAEMLMQAMLETDYFDHYDQFEVIEVFWTHLAPYAKNLTNNQVKSVIDGLVQEIHGTDASFKLYILNGSFTAIAKNLTDNQAKFVIDSLVQVMLETDNFDRLEMFMEHLAPYAKKHTDTQTKLVAEAMVKGIYEMKNDSFQVKNLAKHWTVFADQITGPQAQSTIDALVQAILGRENTNQFHFLIPSLKAIVSKLSGIQAKSVAEVLVQATLETENSAQLYALSGGLTAIAENLTSTQAKSVTDVLVQEILGANPGHFNNELFAIGEVLTVIAKNLTDTQAKSVIDGLVQAILETDNSDQLKALNRVLRMIVGGFTDIQAKSVAELLAQAIHETENINQLFALNRVLVEISENLTDNQVKLVVEILVQSTLLGDDWSVYGFSTFLSELTDAQVKLTIEGLVQAINDTTEFDKLYIFIGVLIEYAQYVDKLTYAQAKSVAERLLQMQANLVNQGFYQGKEEQDFHKRKKFSEFLVAFAKKLTNTQTKSVIESMVFAIHEAREPSQLYELGASFKAFVDNLTDIQIKSVVDVLVQAILETKNSSQFSALEGGLIAIADHLTATQANLVTEALMPAFQEIKDLRQLGIVRYLPMVTNNFTDNQAKLVAERLVQAIHRNETVDSYQSKSFSGYLATFADNLTDIQAKSVAEMLVQVILETDNSGQLSALGGGLTAITGKLTAIQAKSVVEMLVQAMLDTSNTDRLEVSAPNPRKFKYIQAKQLYSLGLGLVSIANKLTDIQAKSVAKMLVQVILETDNSSQLSALGGGLTAITGKLTAIQAKSVVEMLVRAMLKTRHPDQLSALDEGFIAITDKLMDIEANPVTEMLVQAILETKSSGQLYSLGLGLATITNKLTDTQAKPVAEMLVQAILETENSHQLSALEGGLTAITNKLMDIEAKPVADVLVQAILETENSSHLPALEGGLTAITDKLMDIEAKSVVDVLVQAILETENSDQLKALRRSLIVIAKNLIDAAQAKWDAEVLMQVILGTQDIDFSLFQYLVDITDKFTDTQSKVVAEVLVREIYETQDDDKLKILMTRYLPVLTRKLTVNESNLADVFNILRNPIISKDIENNLLYILRTYLNEESSKNPLGFWPLVESAQKAFPELNI